MSDPARPDPSTLVATRLALHAVAEHVVAADLYRHTGHIGLVATPGGFGTPEFAGPDGPRRVRVEGNDLVIEANGQEVGRTPLTTLGAAAALTGTDLGGPAEVYTLQTDADPDAELSIDTGAAASLAAWFDLSATALEALGAEAAPGDAPVQLWPEHFDVACTIAEVNYGGSPGDEAHDEPYLYVGPWTPRTGDFWNESFGASRPAGEVADVDAALAFFRQGHAATN